MMHIGAAGLVCSVGLGAEAACAALRAGIAGFDDLPYRDRQSEPIVGSAIPGLSMEIQFEHRLVKMLTMALQDCLSGMSTVALQNVPLLVGVAEAGRPGGFDNSSDEDIIPQLQKTLGTRFHSNLSKVIPKGHTAGFEGLWVARQLLDAEDIPGCMICAVDSYNNASSLYWLDQHWRLKREDHMNGVIPGEAAGAVYVQRHASSFKGATVMVAGLGFGYESSSILTEDPLQGRGLANATKQALEEAGWGYHDLDFRLSDVTGEEYGFRELTLAEGRLVRVVRSLPQPLWHAADSIGDTGAAAGLVQLAQVSSALARGYAPGVYAGCFASAVPGDRATALIRGAA